jgi:RHS repeat-associated protein
MLPSFLKYFNAFTYDCSASSQDNRIAKHVFSTNGTTFEKSTYYILDAQGNQISTYDHEIISETTQFNLKENNIYGSSRFGNLNRNVNVLTSTISSNYASVLGGKYYEFSNHLGNVLTVFTDKKIPKVEDNNGKVDGYEIGIFSTADYSPFGVELDGRSMRSEGYRYGFQNQKKDDEVKGEGNSVNYKYRMHDPRVGRFFAVDPLASKYPYYSPYSFSGNRVVDKIEYNGKEPHDPKPEWPNLFYGLVFGGISTTILIEFINADFIEDWVNGTYGENFRVPLINGISITIGASVGGVIGGISGLFVGAGVGLVASIFTQKLIGMTTNFLVNKRIKNNQEEWDCFNSELSKNKSLIQSNEEKINETMKDVKGSLDKRINELEKRVKDNEEMINLNKERSKKMNSKMEPGDFYFDQINTYNEWNDENKKNIEDLKNVSNLQNQNAFL